MSTGNSSNDFSGVTSLVKQAGPAVSSAIHKAASATGVDFAYLMKKASVESSFKSDAKAKTSSASGLYQFLDKTWMSMVKKYGDKYGMASLADKIDSQGNCSDPATRHKILSLRNDPEKAACMAAEYDSDNQDYLQQHTNGPVGSTELYLAHFMGAGGAAGFLNAKQDNPLQPAAELFPKAAAANRSIFYDQSGNAKSLAQVYDGFAKKFGGDTATASGDSNAFSGSMTSADDNLAAAGGDTGFGALDSDSDATNAVMSMANLSGGSPRAVNPTGRHTHVTQTHAAGGIVWNSKRAVISSHISAQMNAVQAAMMTKVTPRQREDAYAGRYARAADEPDYS